MLHLMLCENYFQSTLFEKYLGEKNTPALCTACFFLQSVNLAMRLTFETVSQYLCVPMVSYCSEMVLSYFYDFQRFLLLCQNLSLNFFCEFLHHFVSGFLTAIQRNRMKYLFFPCILVDTWIGFNEWCLCKFMSISVHF